MGRFKDGHLEFKVGVAVNKILDEDDFASNDDKALATQQSIRKFILDNGMIQHILNDSTSHIGISGTENNFMSIDSNGLPKDSGYQTSDFSIYKSIQAYNNTTTDVNKVTPTAIIWSGTDKVSSDLFEIDSTCQTRINISSKCLCQISFKINCLNSAAKVNMRSILRVNGSEILRSAVYSYDGVGFHASCTLPAYEYSFEKDDYIEVVAYREGNSGTSNTIPGESFITLKLLRYE